MVSRNTIDPKTGMTIALDNSNIYSLEYLDWLISDFEIVTSSDPVCRKLASDCESVIRQWRKGVEKGFEDSIIAQKVVGLH